MGNVPAENFVVCCLTVSCRTRRTHCPCSLAHSLIFARFVLFMGTTGIGFNVCNSRKIHCQLWNGIIGSPVGEVFDRPNFLPFQNLGSNLANLVGGVSSSRLREGCLQPKSTETAA